MGEKRRVAKMECHYRNSKGFFKSIVALLLAVMLVFGTTFSWIEGSKNTKVEDEECTIQGGAGVEFLAVESGTIQNNTLSMQSGVILQDCSSVDGRNFYFPTTGSIRPSTETSSATDNLVFRKGVEEDVNTKYLSEDFIVNSLESSETSGTTKIYISTASTFTCSGSSLLPFRISLNFNDGTDPVVICPGVTKSGEQRQANAVSSIDSEGKATVSSSTALPMSDYYYGLTPVFELPNGESRRVTVSVWLEGTDSDCTVANVASKDIEMNLILSTEDTNMKQITFVDYTPTTWVQNDGASMYVVDVETSASYKMTKSSDNITYTAKIPDGITSIYFQRTTDSVPDPNVQAEYNSWSQNDTDDFTSSTTFYAIGRGAEIDGTNYGYWVKSSCAKMLDVYLTDNDNTFSINDANGHNPYIYVYSSMYGINKAWGGYEMEHVGENGYGQQVYHMIIPADSGISIIFDNKCTLGHTTHSVTQKQTVSISLSNYITSSDSQVKKIGFYLTGSTDSKGQYNVGTWNP